MTTPTGDDQQPEQPPYQPPPPPGYWEQQAAQQPPPGYGYPPQPYPGYAYPVAPPDHPRATTAMVLGILALVCCQLTGPFAWVIGARAVKEIDASGGRLGGRGQAVAGKVLGIVGTVLLVLVIAYFVLVIGLALGPVMDFDPTYDGV